MEIGLTPFVNSVNVNYTFLNLRYLMTEDTSFGSQSSKLNTLLFLSLHEIRFECLNDDFHLLVSMWDEHEPPDALRNLGIPSSFFPGVVGLQKRHSS